MELEVKRCIVDTRDTFGYLKVNGYPFCATGEPTNRCIPSGRYRVKMTYSPRFKRNMPLICDVPCRSGIRIHTGNHPWKDSAGCLLVGHFRDNCLYDSKVVFAKLLSIIEDCKEDIFINIS